MISTDATIATRILGNFNAGSVTLRERVITKNRVALTTTTGANTDTVLMAVVSHFRKSEIDGTLVLATDLKVIADAAVVVSKASADQVIIGGVTHRVIDVTEVNPAGVVLAYIIQARR